MGSPTLGRFLFFLSIAELHGASIACELTDWGTVNGAGNTFKKVKIIK